MKKETAYEFQKKLRQVHEPDVRDFSKKAKENQFVFADGTWIVIDSGASEVIKTAAADFVDFLNVSMGVEAFVRKSLPSCDAYVRISMADDENVDLGDAKGYKGFMIKTDKNIEIYAHDDRGAAQALYYLEDVMSFEKAPFVEKGEVAHKAAFSPQMVHSGYGFDEYPDEYLARIAHEGRDAILVYTMDSNLSVTGYVNFNELIDRAARYGIDVYSYSYLDSDMSPESEDAEAYYENNYGRLFRECPKLKGVTLVGEAVEFPSRDPHIMQGKYYEKVQGGIIQGKPSSGMYPCEDYPLWLNLLKRVIRKYNPDADIVFWSYNWGSQPEDARVRLIEKLPTDITLQATFEMYEPRKVGNAISHCADYTLAFEGPGKYFASEAAAAKKRGIRLYSMANTGGLTWDFGTIPYEPMPQQWIKRYNGVREAQNKWGLSGLMECHHYGFYPSFISKLSKWAFYEPKVDIEYVLEKILKSEFGEDNYRYVKKATELWSEAIRCYTPSDFDQYGAFRIGPSYPFFIHRDSRPVASYEAGVRPNPLKPEPVFGPEICSVFKTLPADRRSSIPSIRLPEEIKSEEVMYAKLKEGIKELEKAPEKCEKLLSLINMGKYMLATTHTGLNNKRWYVLKNKFFAETDKATLYKYLDEMEAILRSEVENAKRAIPLVEADSRLGWEPRMFYTTDREHLEWKIRQVEAVIEYEIGEFRQSLKH